MNKIFIYMLVLLNLGIVFSLQFQTTSRVNCDVIGCIQCLEENICVHCNQNGNFNPIPNINNTCDCSKGNYLLKDKCLSCSSAHPQCLQCTYNGVLCTACSIGYYLQKGNCPSCGNNCQVCTGPSKCDKCKSGSHWNGSICESCGITNCSTCSKANQCDKCSEGYFVKINTTVIGRKTYSCNKCSDNCLECTNATNCSNCKTGFYLNSSKCVSCEYILHCLDCKSDGTCSKCEDTFYANGSICSSCQTAENHCLNCHNPKSCTSCISQEYYVGLDATCQKCLDSYDGCVTCKFVNNEGICLSCLQSFFLYNKKQCLSCSTFDTHCIQCNNNQQCTKCFGDNNFFILNGQCQSCSIIPHCWTCTSETDCLTCVERFFVKVDKQCLSCSQVIDGCYQCTSTELCIRCNDNFFFDNAKCKACSDFQKNCQTCQDQTHCQTCIKGFYSNIDRVCVVCSSVILNCIECSNSGKCTKCTAGNYLDQGRCSNCISDCSLCSKNDTCDTCKQTFGLNNNNTCQNCKILIPHCNICVDFKSCIKCQDYSFIKNSKCYTCQELFSGCASCSESACSKCKDGFDLTDNTCQQASSSSSAKIIVGVIGGVAVVALGGFLIYRKINRRKQSEKTYQEPTVNQTIITQSQEDGQKQNLID